MIIWIYLDQVVLALELSSCLYINKLFCKFLASAFLVVIQYYYSIIIYEHVSNSSVFVCDYFHSNQCESDLNTQLLYVLISLNKGYM